jgi:hypothetical protein
LQWPALFARLYSHNGSLSLSDHLAVDLHYYLLLCTNMFNPPPLSGTSIFPSIATVISIFYLDTTYIHTHTHTHTDLTGTGIGGCRYLPPPDIRDIAHFRDSGLGG